MKAENEESQLSGQGARYNISGLGTAGSTHVHLKGRHPGTNIFKSRCLVTVTRQHNFTQTSYIIVIIK